LLAKGLAEGRVHGAKLGDLGAEVRNRDVDNIGDGGDVVAPMIGRGAEGRDVREYSRG
jgi:hypothetical protein